MTARQIVAVGLRLFALSLCLGAIDMFWRAAALYKMAVAWGSPLWFGLPLVGLFLAGAAVIWIMSGPLSRWLISGLGKMEATKPSTIDLLAVGCMLMGLWWLKEALIPFVRLWLNALELAPGSGVSAFVWLGSEGKVGVAMYVLQIVASGCLVRGAYPLARWLLRRAQAAEASEASTSPIEP